MKSRQRAADQLVTLFDSPLLRAVSEPSRLEVLKVLLVGGLLDIGEIAARLPIDRSVVSRHLKILEDAGVVVATKSGRHRLYQIDGPALIGALERLVAEAKQLAVVCCPGPAAPPPRSR